MDKMTQQRQFWIAIDCETTGFPPTGHLIEFGAILFDDSGQILDELQTFVCPPNEIPEFISELTGITLEVVADAPLARFVIEEFIEWAPVDAVLIGHNIRFDLEIISLACPEFLKLHDPRCVDSLTIARSLNQFPDNRLHTIASCLFPEIPVSAHRALSDARLVYRFLMEILNGRFSFFRSRIHPVLASKLLK